MLGKLHIFCVYLLAPVIGFSLAFYQFDPVKSFDAQRIVLPVQGTLSTLDELADTLDAAQEAVDGTNQGVQAINGEAVREKQDYEQQAEKITELLSNSQSQTQKSADVLDHILANLLGDPIGQTFGENATVKVYSLEESGYRGYMAKVRLKNPHALKMVLANDRIKSKGETTSHSARRKNAILAVNAGGFMKNAHGEIVPIGITVVDGQVKTFSTNTKLSFVGFNNKGRLVGGKIRSKSEIAQKGILQGASFLPTLLESGKKMPIPREWANARQPRTLIGHFDNGDLLLIVIDGRRKGWSNGVTLEEAQKKLLEFKVRDAYNLDGGGSSAFYYNGKILNRPSDGKERPVSSNIVVLP